MPNQLSNDRVDYTDGSPQTVSQYAKDVTAFMMWAAEPHLEARKKMGFMVIIFLSTPCAFAPRVTCGRCGCPDYIC